MISSLTLVISILYVELIVYLHKHNFHNKNMKMQRLVSILFDLQQNTGIGQHTCSTRISLDMRSANERRRYNVTTSPIGLAHTYRLIPVCSTVNYRYNVVHYYTELLTARQQRQEY